MTMSEPSGNGKAHLLEVEAISKYYGNIVALKDISTFVNAGEVDVHPRRQRGRQVELHQDPLRRPPGRRGPSSSRARRCSSHRRATHAQGIATVYQDLAMVPLMSIWRNFFLGAEPRKGAGPLRWFDSGTAKRVVRKELSEMGIDIRDPDQPVGTLSGGERQSVAIARAVHFGARVLILDEPTSALGVKQAGVVLRYIVQARDRGVAVIFFSHNPHHAYPVGDRS